MAALSSVPRVLQFFSVGGPFLGCFGDSITTAPSYSDPLAIDLNVGFGEYAVGGYRTDQLLDLIAKPSVYARVTNSVLLSGIDDVLQDVSAATIEANLTTLMAKIPNPVVCTLMPFGGYVDWTSGREAVRVAVNTWIKANAATVVDLELVMGDGDPTQPKLLTAVGSADGLHPGTAGNTMLADAIFSQGFNSMVLV